MECSQGICHEIDLFMQGAASVTDDRQKIREKTIMRFGKAYKKVIDYLLLIQSECLNEAQLAGMLNGRDLEDGFFESEIEAARRNGLVIVRPYSDDLVELYGDIRAEKSCFQGGRFHLIKEGDDWQMISGSGSSNNIEAMWYADDVRQDDGETVPWTFRTDIPNAECFTAVYSGEPYCEGLVFASNQLNGNIVA